MLVKSIEIIPLLELILKNKPMTFEIAVDKVENFDKKAKEHSGKHLLQDRLKKHNKGDVEWDLKK